MGIWKQVPRVDGMDTLVYQGWDGRRTELVEVEEEVVPRIHSLVEKAKMEKWFEKYFGKKARATLVLDNKGRTKGGHKVQMKVDLAVMTS